MLVEDIPATVAEDLREVMARIDADAVVGYMQRTLRVRPAPSRDDRRLVTKAAQGSARCSLPRALLPRG